MTDYARKLLDVLMGTDRDNLVKRRRRFYEDSVCKNHLIAFCPNELFLNTRSDLGNCLQLHDDRTKADFEEAVMYAKRGQSWNGLSCRQILDLQDEYESKLYYRISQLLRIVDNVIYRQKERINVPVNAATERAQLIVYENRHESILIIEQQIEDVLKEVENVGDSGKVAAALELDKKVDILKLRLEALRQEEARDRKKEVCPVCGAQILSIETSEQAAMHQKGKLHGGFVQMRKVYEQMRPRYERQNHERYHQPEFRQYHRKGSNFGSIQPYERKDQSLGRRNSQPYQPIMSKYR